jgi:hypothetical protein
MQPEVPVFITTSDRVALGYGRDILTHLHRRYVNRIGKSYLSAYFTSKIF